MSSNIENRIEELKLLGWSEAGAKVYSEKLLNENIHNNFILDQNLLISILILIIICLTFISLFIIIYKKITRGKKHSKINDLETKSIDFTTVNNQNLQSKKITSRTQAPFISFIKKEFKSIGTNPDTIIEHILLVIILSYEFILKFLKEISKDYLSKRSCNLNEKQTQESLQPNDLNLIELKEREKVLMKKTNLELKNFLKGVSNTSRMKKKDLVKKILMLEYK